MNDLISRSALIKVLKDRATNEAIMGYMTAYDVTNSIIDEVEEQPTAYSVDKVVEELGKMKGLACDGKSCSECEYTSDCLEGEQSENVAIDKAIEIVKLGCVSDDVCEWRLCDEEANVYDTSCRNPHILIEGTPQENNYEFCPYCGKKIKVVE